MNFVFDFGNVLIEWNKYKVLEQIAQSRERSVVLDGAIFGSGIWESIDAGELTIPQAKELVMERLDLSYEEEVDEILWRWYRYVDVYPLVVHKIKKLKHQGHRIYILSNTSELFDRVVDERLPELRQLIDGKILSYAVKQMKPNQDIYVNLLYKYALHPKQTYFFDDLQENVEAAQKVGIDGYQVTHIERLLVKLESFIK